MPHPHQALLDEYQIAINHLAPTVPEEVRADAQARHDALSEDATASEEVIREALIETGKAEYPHRRAYQELGSGLEAGRLMSLVLEKADEGIRRKITANVASSAGLEAFIRGPVFESAFTSAERAAFEGLLMDARGQAREDAAAVLSLRADYGNAVAKWQAQLETVEEKIAELEALADEDLKWRDEILDKAARFREGFSVTEPDPQLSEIQGEIENWKGTLQV